MLDNPVGSEDVVQVARRVVLLWSGVIGNPVSVDNELLMNVLAEIGRGCDDRHEGEGLRRIK